MLIEVDQIGTGKILVNVDTIEKIIPAVNGSGCVLHFNNSYIAVHDTLKDFSYLVQSIKKVKPSTTNA